MRWRRRSPTRSIPSLRFASSRWGRPRETGCWSFLIPMQGRASGSSVQGPLSHTKEGAMSQEPEDDDLEPEYDFSGAVRGKYYQRYQQGTNVVLLDADVAQAFKDSESVNRALRLLLDLAKQEIPQSR